MRLLLRFTNNQCHPQARRATGPTFVRLGFVSAGLSAMGQFLPKPDHDEPAGGPNFPIAGDSPGIPEFFSGSSIRGSAV